MRMSRLGAATWVSAIVMLSAAFGGVLLFAGNAAASSGCSAVVAGENVGNNALQTAINHASSGATICVQAGTYPEQLKIATPGLHIVGAGVGLTTIAPTTGTVNTVDYDSGSNFPMIAVVVVENVSGVVLRGLTVNAAGAATSITGCSPGLVAVDFQNVSSGKLAASHVENAKLAPNLLGCQSQMGVYAYTGFYETGYTPAHATVTISGTTISAYGKGGIVCDDPGLTCVISSDTIVGIGTTPLIGANGIQVGFGAVGTITGDHVSNNAYNGTNGDSATVADDNDFYGNGSSGSGILLYQAGAGSLVTGCTLVSNQLAIVGYQDHLDHITGNHVQNSIAYGIVEYGTPSTVAYITGNTVSNPSTGVIGIFVANGTFYVHSNTVTWSLDSGGQGASQAVTGPGTFTPTSPATDIATAAVQAVSDGGPTHVYLYSNTWADDSLHLATLSVFGGSVTITV
jgi:hypothetical protein